MVIHYSLGLADEMGEEDSKLENLACHFAKLGGINCLELRSGSL